MVQKIRSTRRRRLQKSLVFNRNIYIRLATHFLKRKNIYIHWMSPSISQCIGVLAGGRWSQGSGWRYLGLLRECLLLGWLRYWMAYSAKKCTKDTGKAPLRDGSPSTCPIHHSWSSSPSTTMISPSVNVSSSGLSA